MARLRPRTIALVEFMVRPVVRLAKLANVYIFHCCIPLLYSTRVSRVLNIANDDLSADSDDVSRKYWETILDGVVGFSRATMGVGFACIW